MAISHQPIPQEWHDLFEGRRVVVAEVPPSAASPPLRRTTKIVLKALLLALLTAGAAAASMWLAQASGRWWIGVMVFTLIAWVLSFFVIGLFGSVKVVVRSQFDRRTRAMLDPIGRLLPDRGSSLRARKDPRSFAPLFALPDRPTVVFDHDLIAAIDIPKVIGSLAPRGRMPEPEPLGTSQRMAGSAFFGLSMIFSTGNMWLGAVKSTAGTTLGDFLLAAAILLTLVSVWMIVSDPWLHRKLKLSNVFSADAVVGAGWLRDTKGRVFTVDDSLLLITLSGTNVHVRCVNAEGVSEFYLPIVLPKKTPKFGSGKTRVKTHAKTHGTIRATTAAIARDTVSAAAMSVGIESDTNADADMPGPDQPLRLLLSSWTYPEPRTDLARATST